jgi:hypothetical protein
MSVLLAFDLHFVTQVKKRNVVRERPGQDDVVGFELVVNGIISESYEKKGDSPHINWTRDCKRVQGCPVNYRENCGAGSS